jgi:hypothetical protein
MQLLNLKRNMKSNNFETKARPATANTIVSRKQKQLEIFDYFPTNKEPIVN